MADIRHDGGARSIREKSAREMLTHPMHLAAIPVYGLYVLGRRYGFVADEPYWLLLGSLVVAHVTSVAFALAFPPGGPRARPVQHVGLEIALIGLNVYVTGWGALLAIGFVFSAAVHMGLDGARIARAAIAFVASTVAVGELAVSVGLVKSLVPEPQGHGLAVLEGLGACLVILMLAWTQREKETVETSLRRSEERLRALVQHASDVIMVIGPDGAIAYASPALARVLGHDHGAIGNLGGDVIHPDHAAAAREFFADLVDRPGDVGWIEVPLRHRDGTYHWFEVGVTNRLEDPAVRGMVCNMRDVTERRVAQEELTFQARHDALTKLPNRRYFLQRLEQALGDAASLRRHVAVLFLDVDRFKLVNDSLGHEIGDRMLVAVAERLSSVLRPADLVARFGGDEFTILLGALTDPAVAVRVAERVNERLRQPVVVEGHELFLSASMGIAISRGERVSAGDLLRQADLAMYVAKEKGRSRWELFDPSTAPHVMERLELEGDLWRALEHRELMVHFQPEIELSTGRVVATEALVRWEHPRRGVLEPAQFVPFAEETSLIVAIDRSVLREACRWARRWATLRPGGRELVVSVNLSPRFMRQADMVEDVRSVLRETGADPRCVQLEITERSALTDLDTTFTQLTELRALGLRVAIDDFGTGYSSLSYLKRLPIDVLKLDRSFLDSIDAGEADIAIVQAVVTMGHALGVKVTAEGVERRAQAERLRELGCDSAMGWFWSEALPPEALAQRAAVGFPVATADPNVVPLRRA